MDQVAESQPHGTQSNKQTKKKKSMQEALCQSRHKKTGINAHQSQGRIIQPVFIHTVSNPGDWRDTCPNNQALASMFAYVIYVYVNTYTTC